MQFTTATFTAILAAAAVAAPAPAPARLEARAASAPTVSQICSGVLSYCNAHGSTCDKVCTVGMGAFAGIVIPVVGSAIGAVWCGDMKAAVTCASNPSDPSCQNLGNAILSNSAANAGLSPAQLSSIKSEVGSFTAQAQAAANAAAAAAAAAAKAAADAAAAAANKAKSWSCQHLHIGC